MRPAPLYALRDVRVDRGERTILDLPSLTVAPAAIAAVIGGNGAGKSTLLRLLAFLLEPAAGRLAFAGEVVLDGSELARVAPHRRGIGLVFQDHALFPHRAVLGNVAFGLRMRGDSPEQVALRTSELLSLVGLTGFERRSVGSLSGGETQRVALARALACAPDVLLFDEPTANVDRASVPLIEAALARLPATGCTVILATHDTDQAQRLADAVICLDRGQVVAPPVVTVLHGNAVRRDDRWLFDSAGLHLELPAEAHPDAVAIDANDVIVSLEPLVSSARNHLRGRIVAIEPDAEGVLLTVDCGQPLRARITEQSRSGLGLHMGTEVWVTFKAMAVRTLRDG
jgi:molybdopterin-binding protein